MASAGALVRTDLAHRPRLPDRRRRRHARGRGLRRHQFDQFTKRRDVPRRLLSFGSEMGAAADMRERGVEIGPWRAQHFGDGDGIGAVIAGAVRAQSCRARTSRNGTLPAADQLPQGRGPSPYPAAGTAAAVPRRSSSPWPAPASRRTGATGPTCARLRSECRCRAQAAHPRQAGSFRLRTTTRSQK